MKTRLIITYILSLLDLAFTLYLSKYGDIEANPFGRALLKNTFLAIAYKVVIVGAALIVIYSVQNKFADVMSWVLLAVFVALTIYHIVLIGIAHYILFIK